MGFLEVVKEKKLLIPQIQSYLTALFSGQKQENRIEIWSDYSPSSIGYTVNSFFKEKIEEEKLQDIEKFLRMLSEQIPFSVLQTSLQEEAVWGAEVEQISTKISAPEQNSVEKLMHSAPLEALAQATNNSGEGVKDILEKAKGLFEEVQNYLQDTQTGAVKKGGGSFSFLQTSIRLIESVSTAFGMGNFFQVAGNSMQSQSVPQQLMTVAAFFGMVALTCAPSLANSAGKGLVIGSLIGLGALSLLWFFLKPLPTSLPHAAWWSTAVRPEEGFIQLKKQTLDVLAQALRSFSHPLLVENAEGSNHLTLKAFLHAVKRGDYPFLQEKRFFYLNMQEILTHNEAYAILHNIARTMGRGRKKIVLILDKCEALFTKPGSAAELCKSFLEKEGKFPHVIGLTQQKNYATSIEPYMLFLPFQRIDIETASKEETLKFVLSFLLKEPFSKPLIEERALEYLYQASVERGQFQPLGTLTLLQRAISLLEKMQEGKLGKKQEKLSTQIFTLYGKKLACYASGEKSIEIAYLKKEMLACEEPLEREKKELSHLTYVHTLLIQATKLLYKTASLLVENQEKESAVEEQERQKAFFLLLDTFLIPLLKQECQKIAQKVGVKIVIDQEIVQKAVEQMDAEKA